MLRVVDEEEELPEFVLLLPELLLPESLPVLAASVFHFGTFSIRQVKEYMASQGIPVRLDF